MMVKQWKTTKYQGYTLAELLISLGILGVIATFTIPKVVMSQQSQRYNATTKEAASMIGAAYQKILHESSPNASTRPSDFIPYLNYILEDSSSVVDEMPGNVSTACNASRKCLTLHGGGKLVLWEYSFGGTATTNMIFFQFDPDGIITDGTTNGPGKSVKFALYFNGRLTTRGDITPGSKDSFLTYNPSTAADPTWFSW